MSMFSISEEDLQRGASSEWDMLVLRSKLDARLGEVLERTKVKSEEFKILYHSFGEDSMEISEKLNIIEKCSQLMGEIMLLCEEAEFLVGLGQ